MLAAQTLSPLANAILSTYQLTETFFIHRNVHCMSVIVYIVISSTIHTRLLCTQNILVEQFIFDHAAFEESSILVAEIYAAFISQNVA